MGTMTITTDEHALRALLESIDLAVETEITGSRFHAVAARRDVKMTIAAVIDNLNVSAEESAYAEVLSELSRAQIVDLRGRLAIAAHKKVAVSVKLTDDISAANLAFAQLFKPAWLAR